MTTCRYIVGKLARCASVPSCEAGEAGAVAPDPPSRAGTRDGGRRDQYSSASKTVSTRCVTAASAGFGERCFISRSEQSIFQKIVLPL